MAKVAAKAKETKPKAVKIHEFVGQKISELRGKMPQEDFARRNGLHPVSLREWEDGQPCCTCMLTHIARRNDLEVGYFFPNGEVPADYPEH